MTSTITRLSRLLSLTLFISCSSVSLAQEAPNAAAEPAEENAIKTQEQYDKWATDFVTSLTMKTGSIPLQNDLATLALTDNFYYLSPADTKRMLEEAWGNPPGGETLGMIFPTQYNILDAATWGVTISFEELGYVEDDDAADIDYDELLDEMKSDTEAENGWRAENGYDPIELIGWASPPYYDDEAKKLHWAKEFRFGTAELNTLNYNVRILGRRGVLVLNFIATVDQLDEINAVLPTVLDMTNFQSGNTYAEFDPDIDTVAAIGIGGLIAGKVLAKSGLLVAALLFLKKFWFLAFAALAPLWKWVKGRKNKNDTPDSE